MMNDPSKAGFQGVRMDVIYSFKKCTCKLPKRYVWDDDGRAVYRCYFTKGGVEGESSEKSPTPGGPPDEMKAFSEITDSEINQCLTKAAQAVSKSEKCKN